MFAFSQQDPRTSGMVIDPPTPINRYLGAAWDQGREDSILGSLSNVQEYLSTDSDPKLSIEDLNHRYGFPGMQFHEPVSEERAKLISDRRRAQMDRAFYLNQASLFSGRGLAGMGTGLVASISNPVDFASLFIPFVGQERGAGFMARGIVPRSVFEGLPAKNFFASVAHGMMFQAAAEVPLGISRQQEQQPLGEGDAIRDVLMGGAFAGGIHAATMGLLRLLGHDTREAMLRKALNDALEGKSPDVGDVARSDPEASRRTLVANNEVQLESAVRARAPEELLFQASAEVKSQLGLELKSLAVVDSYGRIYTGESYPTIERAISDSIHGEDYKLEALSRAERGFVTAGGEFIPSSFAKNLGAIEKQPLYQDLIAQGASADEARASVLQTIRNHVQQEYLSRPDVQALVQQEHEQRVRDYVKREQDSHAREQARISEERRPVTPPEQVERHRAIPAEEAKSAVPDLKQQNDDLAKELEEEFKNLGMELSGSPRAEASGTIDKLDEALKKLKIDIKGPLEGVTGMPAWLWNGAIDAVRVALQAGRKFVEAVEEGVKYLKGREEVSDEELANFREKLSSLATPAKVQPGKFFMVAERMLEDPQKVGISVDKQGMTDARQLLNRLRNIIPPQEFEWYDKFSNQHRGGGLSKMLDKPGKVSMDAVRNRLRADAPDVQVEVHDSGKQSSAETPSMRLDQEIGQLQHWIDTNFTPEEKKLKEDFDIPLQDRDSAHAEIEEQAGELVRTGQLSKAKSKKLEDWAKLMYDARRNDMEEDMGMGPYHPDTYQQQTSHHGSQTTLLVKDPELKDIEGPHFGESDRGVLAHVRGRWVERGGKRYFDIMEVQSDMGEALSSGSTEEALDGFNPEAGHKPLKDSPLLKDYNRLALKAALDYALKNDAAGIIIDDPETAMLTQGHDKGARDNINERLAQHNLGREPRVGDWYIIGQDHKLDVLGSTLDQAKKRAATVGYKDLNESEFRQVTENDFAKIIKQEKGMRLNYGKILPDIMRQLTGKAGEEFEVGPHENALQTYTNQRGPQFPGEKGPRRDLIFKTPEGEPKTTATGLKYDLSQARETYAQNQGVPLMAGGKFKPVEVGKIFEEQSRNYVNAVDTALKCMLRRVV